MHIIDLSHSIHETMPLYPGTPAVRVEQLHRFETDGFREKRLTFTSHTGTHVDAPAHMLKDGRTLDQLPLSRFYGQGAVLDVRAFKGRRIPVTFLEDLTAWRNVEFVLFYTGFDIYWENATYFENFPVLSVEAADLLLSNKQLKGVGFDAISPDPIDSADYPIHHKFFAAEKIIIENLTNLRQLLNKEFKLALFPLPLVDADGMPVRVVALPVD